MCRWQIGALAATPQVAEHCTADHAVQQDRPPLQLCAVTYRPSTRTHKNWQESRTDRSPMSSRKALRTPNQVIRSEQAGSTHTAPSAKNSFFHIGTSSLSESMM